jgi:AP endonuclease-2
LLDWLEADVRCLQVSRDQLDEPTAIVQGYVSFFSFCKTKNSGVATFTKVSCYPVLAEEGVIGTLVGSWNDTIGCYGNMDLSQRDLAALDLEG